VLQIRYLAHILIGEPVPTPHQVRGWLSPEHALVDLAVGGRTFSPRWTSNVSGDAVRDAMIVGTMEATVAAEFVTHESLLPETPPRRPASPHYRFR